MKKIDTDADKDLDPGIKEVVWVDTVGWDDADLQGKVQFHLLFITFASGYLYRTSCSFLFQVPMGRS